MGGPVSLDDIFDDEPIFVGPIGGIGSIGDVLDDGLTFVVPIGRPLPLGQPKRGAGLIVGNSLGILGGNPPTLDVAFAGGWHFKQSNGWDAWFTIIPNATGGYRIASPASRLTGKHGTAMRGEATHANVVEGNQIRFDVSWANGSRGTYQGGFGGDGVLRGVTGGIVTWEGSRMPMADIDPPETTHPVLSVQAVPNQHQDGFNVKIGGGGFVAGAAFRVDGRVTGPVDHEWTLYAEGVTDVFGQLFAEFGVTKPVGYRYIFRAEIAGAGVTPEVGFS